VSPDQGNRHLKGENMEQIEVAAKMAGEWWAERLAKQYADKRQEFAKAVEMRVLQELRGECYWDRHGECYEGRGYEDHSRTENDYDPHNCLIPALAEAIPDVPEYKLRTALPQKHTLDVYADKLKPKEGYGNWTKDVLVPAVGDA
jgi:hypothetical protein